MLQATVLLLVVVFHSIVQEIANILPLSSPAPTHLQPTGTKQIMLAQIKNENQKSGVTVLSWCSSLCLER